MTISSTTNRVTATGNGVTTSFSFPYSVIAAADLKVYVAGVLQTITTHYTLSGTAPYTSGTNVQFVTAPATDAEIVILRDPSIVQSVDLVENTSLPVESQIERPLDLLTMIAQRLADRVGRTLRQPDTDVTDIDELPAKADRASLYLGFDADGHPVALAAPANTTAVTAFVATLLDDPDAATFLATLGFTSTDAGAAAGPEIPIFRDSASPAVNDVLGTVKYDGRSSTGQRRTYARLAAEILDATNASEDARFLIQAMVAGTLTTLLRVSGTGIEWKTINLAKVAQILSTQTGAVATGTTVIPTDDTIPQNTEGDQYMTLAITPKDASSKLHIEVTAILGNSAAGIVTAALFKDSDAGALAAAFQNVLPGEVRTVNFVHIMDAGTTSAITFKVRGGGSAAGTTTFNGTGGARLLGGVLASSIRITEVLP